MLHRQVFKGSYHHRLCRLIRPSVQLKAKPTPVRLSGTAYRFRRYLSLNTWWWDVIVSTTGNESDKNKTKGFPGTSAENQATQTCETAKAPETTVSHVRKQHKSTIACRPCGMTAFRPVGHKATLQADHYLGVDGRSASRALQPTLATRDKPRLVSGGPARWPRYACFCRPVKVSIEFSTLKARPSHQ